MVADPRTQQFWIEHADGLRQEVSELVLNVLFAGVGSGADNLGGFDALVNWDVVNRDALDYLKMYLDYTPGQPSDAKNWRWLTELTENTRRDVVQEIHGWIERGDPLSELETRLRPFFGKTRAEMIAATEVTRVYAEGNLIAWKSTGLVEGKQWMTAQDELVCPICGPLAGKVVPIDGEFEGGINAPPAHVRCRCWLQPMTMIKEEEQLPAEQPEIVQPIEVLEPAGISVSSALEGPKSGKYAQLYNEALEAIDSIHGDGDLPTIPIKTNSNMRALGEFRYTRAFERGRGFYIKPVDIRINGKGDHHQLTLAHEVGHFLSRGALDPSAGGNRRDLMHDWYLAIENSAAVQSLQDKQRNPEKYETEVTYTSQYSGKQLTYTTRPDRQHLHYLLDDEEVWARSYSQYIAVRSENGTMLSQLQETRESQLYGDAQWGDEDFIPIANAIDKLFRGLGWLR